jgi:hypothetical protein
MTDPFFLPFFGTFFLAPFFGMADPFFSALFFGETLNDLRLLVARLAAKGLFETGRHRQFV